MLLIDTLNQLAERPTRDFDAANVISWWESRRIVFNVAVGLAGFLAIIRTTSFSLIVGTECGI